MFATLGTTIITLIGSIVMVIFTVRVFHAWATKKWGEVIIEILAVIVIGYFVWVPDSAKATIQGWAKQLG